ncbi:hypothetical protein LTR78_001185 [Recurvomyces mirabilis]|uniref:Uncharacterized protein n=1 Tax=Recurvomyces mirabilis TaxID=574656 RepID=A0AAE0WVT7_9PEZI|nr:hypothetical protein LTR78_001185 [Recurvomyces mirabilis]KAK5161161.1 hypothetical protein LTS14_000957 [Recurvomyces mirabilis]
MVRIIAIKPYDAHSGSGSLLFHWLDDQHITTARDDPKATIVRLLRIWPKGAHMLSSKDALNIGRASIAADELRTLRQRGLEWVIEPEAHARFIEMPVPWTYKRVTTSRAAFDVFPNPPKDANDMACGVDLQGHPMLQRLQSMRQCVPHEKKATTAPDRVPESN